jgi:TfoX/Sxy family transcriptional regulator of competence genes
MTSSIDTLRYILDQASLGQRLEFKRLFGEFALYLDGKVVAFVCDDQLFLKPTDQGKAFLGTVKAAPIFPDSKDYYLLSDELDDPERLREAILITAQALPIPKPKGARSAKRKATK